MQTIHVSAKTCIMQTCKNADITLMKSAGEGGAWGIALLAAFAAREDKALTLAQFLNEKVFGSMDGSTASPDPKDVEGINAYMQLYKAGLAAERAAAAI